MTNLVKQNSFFNPTFKLSGGAQFATVESLLHDFLSASPLKTSIYKGNLNFASDIKYSDKELVFALELPAVDTDTLEIKVDNRQLTIIGEKPLPKEEGFAYSRTEILYGRYMRSYYIPDEYDLDSVTSTYKNGVLYISIQRKPETLARTVEIKFE